MMKSALIRISLIFILLVLFIPNLTSAETKTFIKEYTYQASEYDSKVTCRVLALEQVKRLLLEELGTYLESITEVKNFQLTKDQIITLAAGIVMTEIIDEKWDGKTYFLKAKMAADPQDVYKSIDKLRQDRQKTRELEETRKKADEALSEVKKLRKELEIAKSGKTEQGQYQKAVNRLSATDWYEKGWASGMSGKWQEAIDSFSKAIELDPEYQAYAVRGLAYHMIGDNQQAIKDSDKAIELAPDALAYFVRGTAYGILGNYRQAVNDLDQAIKLDPKNAGAYKHRGATYNNLGNYDQAIKDTDRAIKLDPTDAGAYYWRGVAYSKLGDYHQAIKNYNRAIKLDPTYAKAYCWRGLAYTMLHNYDQAIKDTDRAIKLDPTFAMAYCWRGLAYWRLGNDDQGINDLRIAARLGDQSAQDLLRKKEIDW